MRWVKNFSVSDGSLQEVLAICEQEGSITQMSGPTYIELNINNAKILSLIQGQRPVLCVSLLFRRFLPVLEYNFVLRIVDRFSLDSP